MFRACAPSRRTSYTSLVSLALALAAGCAPLDDDDPAFTDDLTPANAGTVEESEGALSGNNLGGVNLGGVNLGGSNLGGSNLGGVNLGGNNLGGNNLGGVNLGGTNLGGNNLGGNNLGATNLGGVNLGGVNLGGVNLGGVNLGGSNLGGSNVAGTNLGGNNLGGVNLGGVNLGGVNTGRNIHNLSGSAANGMLYSAEDAWTPRTASCVVMGLGSTAFAKLLGQQSTGAKISVALGKLPWGFASSAGGAVTLRAWEAVVWGDKTYCVFVMAAPNDATWPGVAGFVKAVFRWNAPHTQTMEISGIEASAPHDPTLVTTIASYQGMMNAAAQFRAGKITEQVFVAGELAFISATTNNQSVLVDFSSWVLDKAAKNPLVLGNVQNVNPPTHAEAMYIALDMGNGNVSIVLDDSASRTRNLPAGMTNSVIELNAAYKAYQAGAAPKPIPRRCGGALFLKTWYNEPVPGGKCDAGLTWASGFCIKGAKPWSSLGGTTGPMNGYMQLSENGGKYERGPMSGDSCGTMRKVLSETYVHMWERNYDLPPGAACTPESGAALCTRLGKQCGSFTGTDNCGRTLTANCGTCAPGLTCGADNRANICGNANLRSYEGEALGNTLAGTASGSTCPEVYKDVNASDWTQTRCSGGAKVRWLGNGSANYVTINNVTAAAAGNHTVTVWAKSSGPRTFSMSVNGGTAKTVTVNGPDWHTVVAVNTTVSLIAGKNTIKLSNSSAPAPDLDRITVVPVASSGGGSVGTCAPAYSQASCLTFATGSVVSHGGRNWTCANANCMNCATYAGCAPGASGCPWGAVWTDAGACQ